MGVMDTVSLSRRQFLGASSSVAAAAAFLPHGSRTSEDDPLGVRGDFSVVREGLYLNSAYITPVPAPVIDAGRAFVESKGRKPIPLDAMLKKADEVRGQFA